jgi:hypothetical protein
MMSFGSNKTNLGEFYFRGFFILKIVSQNSSENGFLKILSIGSVALLLSFFAL